MGRTRPPRTSPEDQCGPHHSVWDQADRSLSHLQATGPPHDLQLWKGFLRHVRGRSLGARPAMEAERLEEPEREHSEASRTHSLPTAPPHLNGMSARPSWTE